MPKKEVTLKFGYQDAENPELKHQQIIFNKRPTGGDFIIAADESGDSDMQFTLGLVRVAITKFGEIEMPCPMTVLLSLNQIDREELTVGYFTFLAESSVSDGSILENGKVELGFGFKRSGQKITKIEFERILNGYDEIEIEQNAKTFWQGNALRIAKETGLTLEEVESLDVDDFTLLRNAEEQWLNSFRKKREDVPVESGS